MVFKNFLKQYQGPDNINVSGVVDSSKFRSLDTNKVL